MLRGLDPLVSKGGNLTHMHDCPNFYFKAKDLISPSAFRSFPRGANSPAELGRLLGLRLGLRYERNSVEWVRGGVAGTVGRRCGEGPATSSRSITQGKGRGHNASCGCRSVAPFPVCLTSNLRSLIRTLKRHLYLFSSKKNPLVLHGRLQRYHQQSTERSCVLRFEPIGRRFRDERSQRIQLPSLT